MLLMIFELAPVYCTAILRASSAITAERTVPLITIESFWFSNVTPLPGCCWSRVIFMRLNGELTLTMVFSSTRS
jgi:hypothetical protein